MSYIILYFTLQILYILYFYLRQICIFYEQNLHYKITINNNIFIFLTFTQYKDVYKSFLNFLSGVLIAYSQPMGRLFPGLTPHYNKHCLTVGSFLELPRMHCLLSSSSVSTVAQLVEPCRRRPCVEVPLHCKAYICCSGTTERLSQ